MIFWIDNTSIYDCRTYSLIKPQQYDVAIILDYIKQDQQQNRIDLKEKLPKLLKTLALLLIIHNKKDIFRLLQILASKDFKYTKIYNDFINNPAAQWYIDQMKIEQVQVIMNQYIQGEYKFLESFIQKIISSYEQFIQKQQNEQGTPEFNQQVEIIQNQDQSSSNKIIDKSQQNQQKQNQINQTNIQQIENQNNQRKKSVEENNSEKDSIQTVVKCKNDNMGQDNTKMNQMINKEQSQKYTLDVVQQQQQQQQQQQLNKEKIQKTTIEIEDKPKEKQQNSNKLKIDLQQQLNSKNQKEQNNIEIQKGKHFTEQQKVSLESVCKDDKPDEKMLEMAKMLSEKVQKKSICSPLQSPSKFKPNLRPLEKITEKVEKRVNLEQKIAKKFNQESDKINSYIDTLTEKEQQEFEFSEDTELIKLFDLLKEKCEQTYWWSKFQDKCHKAMMDKELEIIMFEKLPILMKRWAIKTGKNVTDMERNPNRRHRTPIQDTKNTLLDYSDPEEITNEVIHSSKSQEIINKKKELEENKKIDQKVNLECNEQNNNNGINQLQQYNELIVNQINHHQQEESINLKNPNKYLTELQQHQIVNQKLSLDNLNQENNNFKNRIDEDILMNQNQSILVEQELLLQNEFQEVTPYQIIDIDDDIFFNNNLVDNQKNSQPKVIKTVSNRLNSEMSSKQQQIENPHKYYQKQETQIQNNSENQKNVILIESAKDEIIQNKQKLQQIPQQQTIQITEDCIEIQNQPIIKSNIVYPNIQSEFNQNNDDIDNLFQDDNNIYSPDSMVSSSSILISEQSSIQFQEVQTNKNDIDNKVQLNQNKKKDIMKVPEKIQEKYDIKEFREEEQKSREKKKLESDEIKEKQKNNNKKRQNSKDNNENQKTKSKGKDTQKDEKGKKRTKSSSQNKEKNIEKEKKNNQDILKSMLAEKEAKEKQKEEQRKKEKEKIHQENIKRAEIRLNKMKFDEIEYQKEYNYLQQQYQQNDIQQGEIKHQNQQKNNQQKQSQSEIYSNNINQNQELKQQYKQDKQILDSQNENTNQKYQQCNQYNPQKTFENQSNGNRSQHQSQEKSVPNVSDLKNHQNTFEQQKNYNNNLLNYNQYDQQQRNSINQKLTEQVPFQQNQQQRQNSYAFPLEQYGIQEFLTKKDQIMQKNIKKSIVNPVQYDLTQASSNVNQGNYQKQPLQQCQQNYQQVQQQQQQEEQEQQYQQLQQQKQQQQFLNSSRSRDKKFRKNQPYQQNFYNQNQQFMNQQEPHIQKQRKYNPNYIQGPHPNMNIQSYYHQNQMNETQYANQMQFPFPNGPNYSSNQPSKQQMFEFFCQMFYDKFQQPE